MRYALVLILAVLSAAAHAENFRCGKWIASTDLSVTELVARCGEPASRETRTEDVLTRNRNTGLMGKTGQITVETWIYERGTQAPPVVVTIVDGRIKSIERRKPS
jgi:hypothetical protein